MMTYHLPIATVVPARSDDPVFWQAMRNQGYVRSLGATEPAGFQHKGGRLLVLSEGAGDAGLELERQIGEVWKKRGRKSLLAPSKKWSSKIAKFGGEGEVLQVDFDENDIAASDLAALLRAFDRKGYMGPRASQGDATRVVIAFLDTGLDYNGHGPQIAGNASGIHSITMPTENCPHRFTW